MDAVYCLGHQWIFKCHFCKQEFYDSVAIGVHWRDNHDYNFKSDEV